MASRATALICTALPLETAAVISLLDGQAQENYFGRNRYPIGALEGQLGWDVVICETGPETNVATAAVEAALAAVQPSVVLFVGIAGGFAAQGIQTFDVVVPHRVHQYGAGRAYDTLDRRHRDHEPSSRLLTLARSVAREDRWRGRASDPALIDPAPLPPLRTIGNRSGGFVGKVRETMAARKTRLSPATRAAKVLFDPLASGDHVVKSLRSQTYTDIRHDYDQVVAVDMEAAGFFIAAAQHEEVLRLLVRSVSDLVSDKDRTKNAGNQERAAKIAAAFALEVLAQLPPDQLIRAGRQVHHAADPAILAPDEVAKKPLGAAQDLPVSADSTAPGGDPSSDLLRAQAEDWAELVQLTTWGHRTEALFSGYQPRLPLHFFDDLQSARSWLDARVHPPGAPEGIDAAFSNFQRALETFLDVFATHLEIDDDFARVERFDRQHNLPVREKMDLERDYERHVRRIQNLGLELTRAANLVCERVRRDLDPLYRVKEGKVQAAVGEDGFFVVIDYTDEEREDAVPFPADLDSFLDMLPSRADAYLGNDGADAFEENLLDPCPLTIRSWAEREGVSAGENTDSGRAIERRGEQLIVWVANRTDRGLRLGEALLTTKSWSTSAQRPMHRVVEAGQQVAYSFNARADRFSGPGTLTVQQEILGGRLIDDAELSLELGIDGDDGRFASSESPPDPSPHTEVDGSESAQTLQPRPTRRASEPGVRRRQRLQRELDEGVRLLENCPSSALLASISIGMLGHTTEQDATGWEARVEMLLKNRPALLSRFRYEGKPKSSLAALVITPHGGDLRRRLEQKVANLDKILRDEPYSI